MNHHPQRRRALFASALVLAVLGAACGDDSGDSSETTAAAPTTAAPAPASSGPPASVIPVETTVAPDTQTYGGSLTYGTYGEGTGFDPAIRGLSYCNTALYDSLMKFDEQGVAQPYMAESMTTEDNITWTMKLRPGIEFHDGTPLNAEAVLFNIQRHQNPETKSQAAPFTRPIASMTVVDDLTIEFTLTSPLSLFPGSFAQANGIGIILSPKALQELGADYSKAPVGAGPFKFVEWIPDDRLTLVKNENYWQEGLPYLDELICRPLPDTQTRFQAIVAGDTDFTYMITAAEIKQAEDNSNLVTLKAFGNGGEGILLNDNRPPFDDLRMRQAFVHMLNLDAIAQVRFAGQRELAGAIGLVAPAHPLYNPAVEAVWPKYDVEAAKALIEAYKADGGDPNFAFTLPNTPDRRAFGEMSGQFFKDAGLNVELKYLDISEFVVSVLNGNDFQAAINSYPAFVGMYPQIWNAFHSTGTSNFGKFSDPDVDAALEEAVGSTDPAKAADAWKRVQLLVAEKIPFATYGRPPSAIITQPYVAGVVKYPDNTLFFATLSRES